MLLISIFVLLLGLGIMIVNINARDDAKNCSDKLNTAVAYNIYVGGAILLLGCTALFLDITNNGKGATKFSF